MNVETINERLLRTERERDEATRERDAYKKAKQENDERFMRERDEALADAKRLAAQNKALAATMNEDMDELARLRAVHAQEVKVTTELWEQAKPYLAAADLGRTWAGIIKRLAEAEKQAVTERDAACAELARLRAAANERAIAELEALDKRYLELNYDVTSLSRRTVLKRIAALRAEQQAAPAPQPVTPPADAPSRPHIKALLMDVVNHQPVREVPLPVLRLLRELVEIVDALAGRGGAQ